MSEKLERAKWWLDKGFQLLPCQPNQKALIGGFGQYRAKITDMAQGAKFWGIGAACNMAVIAPDGFYILDFDKISVFAKWAEQVPAAAQSYTEETPRGGRHVFLIGDIPPGVQLIDGAEIKRVVLVSPSKIGEDSYKILLERPFYNGDVIKILSPISKPGHATPYALQASQAREKISNPLSHVEQIKNNFLISDVLAKFRPNIKINPGNNDFQACECPLEKHRSKAPFFFNDHQGFWKCHACGIGGDVINLYARFELINVREAISRMWSLMAVRS